MINPRTNQMDASMIDEMSHFWAVNIGRIADVVKMSNEMHRRTHQRVRENPRNFIEMTGAIRTDSIPHDPLLRLATIAETLVMMDEMSREFKPLLLQYRANVDVLFIKFYRTILEGILATFLGDDKAKDYADRAEKKNKGKPKLNMSEATK